MIKIEHCPFRKPLVKVDVLVMMIFCFDDHFKNVLAAPAFPVQAFPNGYPGYPMRGDSSQPSLADDHGHSLMGLEDQVTLLILFFLRTNFIGPVCKI